MNIITVNEVTKVFEQKIVLDNINFSIPKGEIFGLLGPSGAGKTTLIKILTGQLTFKGKAEIMRKSCDKPDKSLFKHIGMVLDNTGLYDRLSSYDNLLLFARLHDIPRKKVNEILNRVWLDNTKVSASKLSKGMKQRLALARALLHHPDILFLDEPTSGLDPAAMAQIHKLLLELKEEGTTIFLTTHNMEEAHKLCDHIALLHEGRLVEYGTPDELCRKYNNENIITILLKDGQIMKLQNKPESAQLLASLLQENKVETIHSSEPNLETVFMKLTGKELNQ